MHPHTLSFVNWQNQQSLDLQKNCPAMLQDWLKDTGSLTARLVKLSKGNFRVEVLFQGFARIRLDERQLLGLPRPAAVLVREVVLYGNNQPWVFARSLLPLSSLTGRLRQLRKISSKPLGAFLFKQPDLIRSPLIVAKFTPADRIIPKSLQQEQPLWGRGSVFYVRGKPLLVSEVFLSDFIQTISRE